MLPPKSSRPVLKIPFSSRERGLWGIALVLWAYDVYLAASSWGHLPERLPMKFGWDGTPISWGPPGAIWLLPILSTFMTMILWGLAQVPHVHNIPWKMNDRNRAAYYQLSRELLAWVVVGLNAVLTLSNAVILDVTFGRLSGMPLWFLPFVLVVVAVPSVVYFIRGNRIAKSMSV